MGSVVLHWNRLPSQVIDSLSLKVCKRDVDVMLRDKVKWWTWTGLTVGLYDFTSLCSNYIVLRLNVYIFTLDTVHGNQM